MSYKEGNGQEEEYYREHLLPKFAKMTRQEVPSEIWQNVRANIQEKQNVRKLFDRTNIFVMPRYSLAVAAVFVFISLSAVGYREVSMYKEVNHSLNSMVSYLSSDLSLVGGEIQL
jgi:hypothetical protein